MKLKRGQRRPTAADVELLDGRLDFNPPERPEGLQVPPPGQVQVKAGLGPWPFGDADATCAFCGQRHHYGYSVQVIGHEGLAVFNLCCGEACGLALARAWTDALASNDYRVTEYEERAPAGRVGAPLGRPPADRQAVN